MRPLVTSCLIRIYTVCYRPKMPLGGDIALDYLRSIYEWYIGSRGERYLYDKFYEEHSILHFNRK